MSSPTTPTRHHCRSIGLSGMRGNPHVPFLGEEAMVTPPPYPTVRSCLAPASSSSSGLAFGFLSSKLYRVMDIEEIKTKVRANEYIYSHHADLERKADDLTLAQVEDALLTGEILEQYPDTGRGESCLVVGFSGDTPIHAVCGWRGDKVVLITVYIPGPPQFVDPRTRGEHQ
jgi:hypothetical protein